MILLFETSLLISLARTSIARTNRKGDKGSPCLTPLLRLKKLNGLPLIKIENEVVVTHCIIHYIQMLGKPKAQRNSLKSTIPAYYRPFPCLSSTASNLSYLFSFSCHEGFLVPEMCSLEFFGLEQMLFVKVKSIWGESALAY